MFIVAHKRPCPKIQGVKEWRQNFHFFPVFWTGWSNHIGYVICLIPYFTQLGKGYNLKALSTCLKDTRHLTTGIPVVYKISTADFKI